MASDDRDLRALGEVDRPIRPTAEAQAAMEARMLAAFDDAVGGGGGAAGSAAEDEVLDLPSVTQRRRRRGQRLGILLATAAAVVLVAVGIVVIAGQSPDSNLDTTPADPAPVAASVGELCRVDVPRFASAFEVYREASNPFRNEGRDEALIGARTALIAAIEQQVSTWPDRYAQLVADPLDRARSENDRARELLGQPSPLIDPHHAASQEALVAIFATADLPGVEGCDTSGIAWRPAG